MLITLMAPLFLAAQTALIPPGVPTSGPLPGRFVLHEVPHAYLVRGLGDVDGDGVTDFVGTIHFGGVPAGDLVNGADGTPLIAGLGPETPIPYQGVTSGSMGDVNGDGVPDLGLGGPLASEGGAAVLSGLDGELLFVATGTSGSSYGSAMTGLGDWDGDGHDEFAIAASSTGAVFLHDGASTAQFDVILHGTSAGDFGARLLSVADRTGDGIRELYVSAPRAALAPGVLAGKVYLLDPTRGAVLLELAGAAGGDRFGIGLDEAGDLDGDGVPDLVVGASQAQAAGTLGRGYVQARSGTDGRLLWQRTGQPGDTLGRAIASVGDLDGDGLSDLALGAPQNALPAYPGSGYVQFVSGADGSSLHRVTAPSGTHFGNSLAALGDVNGDGVPDLAVGGLQPDQGFASRGFILSGKALPTVQSLRFEALEQP